VETQDAELEKRAERIIDLTQAAAVGALGTCTT
jgi:hypothetical protein